MAPGTMSGRMGKPLPLDAGRRLRSQEFPKKRPFSARHLEYQFQFNRNAEGQAGDTVDEASGNFFFSEDVLQEARGAVGDFRVLAKIAGSGHGDAETHDAGHFIERAEMLAGDGESV